MIPKTELRYQQIRTINQQGTASPLPALPAAPLAIGTVNLSLFHHLNHRGAGKNRVAMRQSSRGSNSCVVLVLLRALTKNVLRRIFQSGLTQSKGSYKNLAIVDRTVISVSSSNEFAACALNFLHHRLNWQGSYFLPKTRYRGKSRYYEIHYQSNLRLSIYGCS